MPLDTKDQTHGQPPSEDGGAGLYADALQRGRKNAAQYWHERMLQIQKAGLLSFFIEFFMAVIKLVIGSVSGSSPIRTDGVKGITDSFSALVTVFGIRSANRPPDKKHPYGYGRMEYVATILTAVIILITGWNQLTKAVGEVMHPETAKVSLLQILVILMTILGKQYLFRIDTRTGNQYHSSGLISSGKNALYSEFSTALTVLSAILVKYFNINLDGYVSIILALLILRTGLSCFKSGVSVILTASPSSELASEVYQIFESNPPIAHAGNLILNDNGSGEVTGTLNVTVPSDTPASEIYKAVKRSKKTVLDRCDISLTVGVRPCNAQSLSVYPVYERVASRLKEEKEIIDVSAFYYDREKDSVSVAVSINKPDADRDALSEKITGIVQEEIKGAEVSVDIDYGI